MRPIAFGLTVTIASVSAAAWLVAVAPPLAQINVGGGQGRDVNSQPQMRAIPVGTASISGTVTAADGGRPVRDARVTLNGAATVPEGALPPVTANVGMGAGRAGGVIGGAPGVSLSVNRTVVTDASGNFTFAKLPAGHFTLSISKNNYLTTNYGQRRAGAPGATILITDGERKVANTALMRGGVITGTIYDENGDPVVRAQVSAWRYSMVNGVRRLSQSNGSSTDDRGVYRLTDLQPADYMVGATANAFDVQMAARMNPDASAVEQAIATGVVRPPAAPGLPATVMVPIPQQQVNVGGIDGGAMPSYLPTFHPGTPVRGNATVIHVTGGDEHPAVDIIVQPVMAGSIQGTIATPLKQGVSVRLWLLSNDPGADNNSSSGLDQNGKFNFRSVAPGQYTVMAQTIAGPAPMTIVNGVVQGRGGPAPQLSDDDRLWGSASANVEGGTQATVAISLRAGRSISGIVQFETEKPPDFTRTRVSVSANPAPGASFSVGPTPQVQVDQDGRFTIQGVIPGRYILRVNAVGTMKSAMVANVDTLDFPLDFPGTSDVTDAVLTVTDKPSELSGTLTEASGKPGIDYTVIAAPVDDRFWTPGSRRIATSRSGADGKYMFRSLPPGDYYIVVVNDLEQGAQYDPEFLRTLGGVATRVTVTDGGKTSQDLRVR